MPERPCKHVEITRSPTNVPSVEQFLRGSGGDSCRVSPTYSPTSTLPSSPYSERMKHQDLEDDHGLNQKKSVLNKVREKAKKLCSSLSKRRMDDENVIPSWGVRFEEEEEEEEDPEYLGAPMYESELAPETYKENARQHPRANPVISEKHVLHNSVKLGVQHDREKPRAAINLMCTTKTQPTTPTSTPRANMASETLGQKLMPVYTGGSLAANHLSSKLQAAVSKNPHTPNSMPSRNSSVSSSQMQHSLSSSASQSWKNTSQKGVSVKDYLMNRSEQEDDAKTVFSMQDLSSPSSSLTGKNAPKSAPVKEYSMNRHEQGNDARTVNPFQKSLSSSTASIRGKNTSQKSVSGKDISMSKSEPRDDERNAFQLQLISEEKHPRRISNNSGMMDKVRGAVNSLLGNEETSQEFGANFSTTRTSSQTQQEVQDENHGRILQAN